MTVASTSRCIWPIVSSPYSIPSAHITNEEVRRRWNSHLSYRKETTSSAWTSCESRRITTSQMPHAHSSSSHQSSSSGLATPRAGRPRRTWLRTIELDLRPITLVLTRGCVRRIVQSGVSLWTGDDYAHWWARWRYSMMMTRICAAEMAVRYAALSACRKVRMPSVHAE